MLSMLFGMSSDDRILFWEDADDPGLQLCGGL
jgi:hypothetical protein